MARIVVGSYMIRYPLGGMMSWVLQYLSGFQRLGHDVWFVERATWPLACFDPVHNIVTDDPVTGIGIVRDLLDRVGLADRWCFIGFDGVSRGVSRRRIREVLDTSDVFIDMGVHGAWNDDASRSGLRVLIDGEPGFTQMKMVQRAGTVLELPPYDHYYTSGRNIGSSRSSAPDAGHVWRPIFHPVDLDLFPFVPAPNDGPVTTVMNWQSYDALEFEQVVYGHKDIEFERYIDLPADSVWPLEVAVSGTDVPVSALQERGWRTRNGIEVTKSFDDFREYIQRSRAEFTVCKSGYVATRSGWFSDRSAAYLASGRPVVMQDTGFGEHLPTGTGLFAVRTVDEAAAAISEIADDPRKHGASAREIAVECLDARKVLSGLLEEIGL